MDTIEGLREELKESHVREDALRLTNREAMLMLHQAQRERDEARAALEEMREKAADILVVGEKVLLFTRDRDRKRSRRVWNTALEAAARVALVDRGRAARIRALKRTP